LSFKIILLIDFNMYGFFQAWSLIVDHNLNIYTTLYQKNEKIFLSAERYLCKIAKNGDFEEYKPLANEINPDYTD
jgi:hypothetical protein